MPPRARKPVKADEPSDDDEASLTSSGSETESDSDSPPPAKTKKKPAAAAAAKKKPAAAASAAAAARKRKPKKEDEDDEDDEPHTADEGDDDGGKGKPPPKKKPAASPPAKKAAAAATPHKKHHVQRADPGAEPTGRQHEPATGYTLDPTLPLMWTTVGADGSLGADVEPRAKVAAFDLDGTLVHVKNTGAGRNYPLDEDDWVLFNDRVPSVVRKYHDAGYEIAILSNQGGVQKKLAGKMAQLVKARAHAVAAELGVPCTLVMCPSRDPSCPYRKPQTGMWTFFETELRPPTAPRVDRAQSLYVGDAAGRPQDHDGKGADSDRAFAQSLGLGRFLTPEEAFGPAKGKAPLSAEKWQAGGAAVKAAKEGRDEGAGPNGPLLSALSGLADKIFQLVKEKPDCLPGDDPTKWRFKAAAYKNAAQSIATFGERITLKNLKDVGKLPKVGKSTLDKLKECLESGKIALMGELEAYESAGGAPAGAVPAHVAAQAQQAAAFM